MDLQLNKISRFSWSKINNVIVLGEAIQSDGKTRNPLGGQGSALNRAGELTVLLQTP